MPALPALKTGSLPAVDFSADAALRKLAPNLARAVSETVSAFFNVPVSLAPAWEAPRVHELRRIQCSQKNVGERYQMVFNLATDKAGWDRLFPSDVEDPIKMDAYCELANCICGELLADPGFADWFGYLTPCVPCSGLGCAGEGAHAVKGALRLNGAWIHFSFAVGETAPEGAASLTAAA